MHGPTLTLEMWMLREEMPEMGERKSEEGCDVCRQYEQAGEALKGFPCPWCGKDMENEVWAELTDGAEMKIIGEHNGTAPQRFERLPLFRCRHCCEFVALRPVRITWNANHDIHYPAEQK